MRDRLQSDRCVLHKGNIRRRSCTIRSHRLRTLEDLKRVKMNLCCHGDPMETRWFQMQRLAEAMDQKTLWLQPSKPSMFLTSRDFESRAKAVKFAVFQRHEEQGAAQEHELASFEADDVAPPGCRLQFGQMADAQ